MGTLGFFQEFDPSQNRPPSSPGKESTQAIELRSQSQHNPYYLTDRVDMDFPQPWLAGASISATHGAAFDCVKMQTGLQNTCDTIFWMAPGRPIDQGTKGSPQQSGVWLQARSIGTNISAAASAPFSGL